MIYKKSKTIDILTDKICNPPGVIYSFQQSGIRYQVAYGYRYGSYSMWIEAVRILGNKLITYRKIDAKPYQIDRASTKAKLKKLFDWIGIDDRLPIYIDSESDI